MLVGHNPGFGALAFALARADGGDIPAKLADFPTSAVASFLFEADHWTELDPTRARFSQFFTPRLLRAEDIR
jgi:phosphohistidine phosphatase SixA